MRFLLGVDSLSPKNRFDVYLEQNCVEVACVLIIQICIFKWFIWNRSIFLQVHCKSTVDHILDPRGEEINAKIFPLNVYQLSSGTDTAIIWN